MNVVGVLGWLAEHGVTAIIKTDGERLLSGSAQPWTFVASGGSLTNDPVHLDARSAEHCIRLAAPLLERRGLRLPDELMGRTHHKVVMTGVLRWLPKEAGGRDRPFGGGRYVPTAYVEPVTADGIWSIDFDHLPPGDGACEARASWLAWENEPPIVVQGDRLIVTEGPRPVATFDVHATDVMPGGE